MRTRIAQLVTLALTTFVVSFGIWRMFGYSTGRALVSATAYAIALTLLAPVARRYGRKWRADGSVPVRWRTDAGGAWSRRRGGGLRPVHAGADVVRRGETVVWLPAAEVRTVTERPATWREAPMAPALTSVVTVETAAQRVELRLEDVHLPEVRRWLQPSESRASA